MGNFQSYFLYKDKQLLSLNEFLFCFTAHPKLDYDNRLKGVQNIKAGVTLSLPVNTSGIPNPNVSWLLDEEPVEKTARVSIETVEGKTTLTIKNTTLDDTGLYTVEAENTVGKAVAEFDVNVKGKNNCKEMILVGLSSYCLSFIQRLKMLR